MNNPLKVKRQEMKMTRKEMALRLNCSEVTIKKYEEGSRYPTLDKLLAVAEAYEMNEQEIMGYIRYASEIKNNERVMKGENR